MDYKFKVLFFFFFSYIPSSPASMSYSQEIIYSDWNDCSYSQKIIYSDWYILGTVPAELSKED